MLIKSITSTPSFLAGDKTIIRELLHPANDPVGNNYSLAHASLAVGEASLPHVLKKSAEVYVILQGRGEMHIDGQKRELDSGDIVHIPGGAEQHIINIGAVELQFLCIVDPPWAEADEAVLKS